MMYLLLVFNAIFHPRKTMWKIGCRHPNEKSAMKDAGMDKVFWCDDCGMTAFARSDSAI